MNRDILYKIQAIISDPNRIDEISYSQLSEWEESLPFYQPLKYLLNIKANKLGIHRQQQAQTTAAYLSQEIEFTHDTDNDTEPINHELASDDLESIVTDEVTEVLDHTHFGGIQDLDEEELNHKNDEESNLNNITQGMENALDELKESTSPASKSDSAPIGEDESTEEDFSLSIASSAVEADDNAAHSENSEEEKEENIDIEDKEEVSHTISNEDDSAFSIDEPNNINKEQHIVDVPSLVTTHPKNELVDNPVDAPLEEANRIDNVNVIIDNQEKLPLDILDEIDPSEEVVENDKSSENNYANIDIRKQPEETVASIDDKKTVTHSPILATSGIVSSNKEEILSAFSKENEINQEDIDENRNEQNHLEMEAEEPTTCNQDSIDDSLESKDEQNLSEFTLWLKSTKKKKAKAPAPKKKQKRDDKKDKKRKEKPRKKKKSSKKVIEDANKSNYRDNTIISETLADILASQGHNSEAKKMYNQLSLLFPEKSDYFAAKIKNLKNNS